MNSLAALSFQDVLWLLPAAVVLHVLEELPRFPAWANQTLAPGRGLRYTRAKFVWENVVLFVLLLAAVLMARLLPAASTGARVGIALTLGAAAGTFFNVVFHAYCTLRTGIYSPGTVTACLLFAPVSSIVFFKAAEAGLLTPFAVCAAVVLGLALLPLVVAVVHRAIDRGVTRRSIIKLAAIAIVPAVVMALLGAALGETAMRKAMVALGPLALLPLLLRWMVKRAHSSATEGKR